MHSVDNPNFISRVFDPTGEDVDLEAESPVD